MIGDMLFPANPQNHRSTPIGIATEAVDAGAIIEWDSVKREGTIDGRRVLLARMVMSHAPRVPSD